MYTSFKIKTRNNAHSQPLTDLSSRFRVTYDVIILYRMVKGKMSFFRVQATLMKTVFGKRKTRGARLRYSCRLTQLQNVMLLA